MTNPIPVPAEGGEPAEKPAVIFRSAAALAKAKAQREFDFYRERLDAEGEQQAREEKYADAVAGHEAAMAKSKEMAAAITEKHSAILADTIREFREEIDTAVDIERAARSTRGEAYAALNPGARRSSEQYALHRGVPTSAAVVVGDAIMIAMRDNGATIPAPHWTEVQR